MIKGILASALLLVGMSAGATTVFSPQQLQKQFIIQARTVGIDWKVGDTADYDIALGGGFIKGVMTMSVREIVDDGLWLVQDTEIDLFGQKQQSKAEILIDTQTGAIKEIIVDGKKQNPPDAGDQEITEMKDDKITVPAGTFECVYAKIMDKKTKEESQLWFNSKIVPMVGMIKSTQPSQMGEVQVELTSYKKN